MIKWWLLKRISLRAETFLGNKLANCMQAYLCEWESVVREEISEEQSEIAWWGYTVYKVMYMAGRMFLAVVIAW